MSLNPLSQPGNRRRTTTIRPLFVLPAVVAFVVAGCQNGGDLPDAYGNFEAVETAVSAQSDGELIAFDAREGDHLQAGHVVGQIDTVQLALSHTALVAQRNALQAQVASVAADVEVLQEQLRVAQIEKDRIDRLFEREAATRKQVDDIDGRVSILDRQIASTRTKAASIRSQINAVNAQLAQIEDRIEKSTIVNPISGVVLTTFVEPHELVRTGTQLYRIADLSSLDIRAYIGETQLTDVAIGDVVSVSIDGPGGELLTIEGQVTWIASTAEFTPRTVQTRDERTNLVYAFKARVPNPDGRLKIGMPGDIRFTEAAQ